MKASPVIFLIEAYQNIFPFKNMELSIVVIIMVFIVSPFILSHDVSHSVEWTYSGVTYSAKNPSGFENIDNSLLINPTPEHIKNMAERLAKIREAQSNQSQFTNPIPQKFMQMTTCYNNETAFFSDLEKYVELMDTMSFLEDPVLYKFVDYENRKLSFRHVDQARQNQSAFEISEKDEPGILDEVKDVYVLKKDRVQYYFQRRRFVILRRVKNTPESLHSVCVLYLKEAYDSTTKVHTFGGHQFHVEFDAWYDPGSGSLSNKPLSLGWLHCNSSLFSPCLELDYQEHDKLYRTRKEIQRKEPLSNSNFRVNLFSVIPSSIKGYSTFSASDFFVDLDDTVTTAKWVSAVVEAYTRRAIGKTVKQRMDEVQALLKRTELPDIFTDFQNPVKEAGKFGNVLKANDQSQKDKKGPSNFKGVNLTKQGTYASNAKEVSKNHKNYEDDDEQHLDLVLPDKPISLSDEILRKSLLTRVDTFVNPGWKTMWNPELTPNSSLKVEQHGFAGFGPCENNQLSGTPLDIQITEDKDGAHEVVVAYMKILRYHCIPEMVNKVVSLFTDDYLHYLDNGRIVFNFTRSVTIKPKITYKRLQKTALAVEFFCFASAYYADIDILARPKHYEFPEGTPVSRSVFVIAQMVIIEISTIHTSVQAREVFMFRSMITSLKSVLVRLLQDFLILRDCDKCTYEMSLLKNDLFLVVGMIQFILKEITPSSDQTDVEMALSQFLIRHREAIRDRVDWYASPERGPVQL